MARTSASTSPRKVVAGSPRAFAIDWGSLAPLRLFIRQGIGIGQAAKAVLDLLPAIFPEGGERQGTPFAHDVAVAVQQDCA